MVALGTYLALHPIKSKPGQHPGRIDTKVTSTDQWVNSALSKWSTFSDESLGIAFKYPSEWEVADVSGGSNAKTQPSGQWSVTLKLKGSRPNENKAQPETAVVVGFTPNAYWQQLAMGSKDPQSSWYGVNLPSTAREFFEFLKASTSLQQSQEYYVDETLDFDGFTAYKTSVGQLPTKGFDVVNLPHGDWSISSVNMPSLSEADPLLDAAKQQEMDRFEAVARAIFISTMGIR